LARISNKRINVKKIGAKAIILLIVSLCSLSQPLVALSPTIPSGNEFYIISGNSLKAKTIVTSVKFETLGVKFEEIDPEGYINALAVCESGNNQSAINPVDKDGTSSNGLFQFKRTTWKNYITKYNLFSWQAFEEEDFENALWDGYAQRIVVEKMFKDPEVNLWWEFPDCSQQLNLQKTYGFNY